MRGTALLSVVLVDPAGEAGVPSTFAIVAHIQRGTAVGALDQSGEGLDFVAAVLSPPSFHHLVDGVPQLLGNEGFMGALGDDPLLLRGGNAGLIEEALGFRPSENRLSQIDAVVEDGPDGGGMPVVGLAPVFALEVVGIVLVEVRLWESSSHASLLHTPRLLRNMLPSSFPSSSARQFAFSMYFCSSALMFSGSIMLIAHVGAAGRA